MLYGDFESRSEVELSREKSVGMYNYATHPTTQPLMFGYALDDGQQKLWRIWDGEPMPVEVRERLDDPKEPLCFFNSTFERYLFQFKLGITLDVNRIVDPQVSCRYLSIPGDLEEASDILGLDRDLGKSERGEALIKLFSKIIIKKARKPTKANPLGVPERRFFNDWNSHPAEWQEFCDYCMQDVVAEREVLRILAKFRVHPLPERERRLWVFDQKVNDRGIPVDMQFVKNAYELASRAKQLAVERQNELTGVENSNSPKQMLAWAQAHGYKRNTLEKNAVVAALKYSDTLDPICRKAFEARAAASSTTYKKLAAIMRQVCSDGRLRNQFIFMGSSRCGRWSGNAVQMHNMARPDSLFEDEDIMDEGRAMIYRMDFDGIIDRFGKKKENPDDPTDFGAVLLTVKNLIRTVFATNPTKRFNVCDLNAIETRVAAWVAQCVTLLEVFRPRPGKKNGNCPYLDFASKMFCVLYELLEAEYKNKKDKVKYAEAKRKRQVAKPGVLGCVYQMGGGELEIEPCGDCENCKAKRKCTEGDLIKTGLWGYAENMGVDMTREQAHEVVRMFREIYHEIVECWYDLEKKIAEVLEGKRVVRYVGPDNCIKIDKIRMVREGYRPLVVLRIQLPSGRYLHYMDARIEEREMKWSTSEKPAYKKCFIYCFTNQTTHQWVDIQSRGGHEFENIVQGIARDVLGDKLLEIEAAEMPIDGHVHDEGIAETDNSPLAPGVADMEEIMNTPVTWAPTLLLGSDGFEGSYYHK